FRYRFIGYIEPLSGIFLRLGISPNKITTLSILAGIACACCFAVCAFPAGSFFLFISAILDLIDGTVARKSGTDTPFGAVFDWIADKYTDAIVILGVGLSGIAILTRFFSISPVWDYAVIGAAITGSLMNTFIKPVTYAEIGFTKRKDGKIDDPLEGIGFFGRPETLLILGIGGLIGYIWVSVIIIALCTNLSALQRIIYLYKRYS
ncbi:MAG TPA: CDP-alcohol phosphatidyltransferase family protein, partial [Methanospirillum sp.]|nr:CDP-alcohol phosphatidyltransferase family protein [Methanospirillum sp.]